MEYIEKKTVLDIMMEQFKLIGDFKTGDDMDVNEHRCTGSTEYCNVYNRGYNDEEDFLS